MDRPTITIAEVIAPKTIKDRNQHLNKAELEKETDELKAEFEPEAEDESQTEVEDKPK